MNRTKIENQLIATEATTTKHKSKLYIGTVLDETGEIQKVFTDTDYGNVWLLCVTEAKAVKGVWEIRDFKKRVIDTNFSSPKSK